MGRTRRPYLPGAVFHLTARTIRGERWFTPAVREVVLAATADAADRCDARLLAAAVMSNHLHLVVQQSRAPLSALMQPLLRRVAAATQRAHRLEGPVFWRHYASQPCLDPSYVRNAIVYTHLNPVRAGVCREPSRYRWTTHALYSGHAPGSSAGLARIAESLDSTTGLALFAASGDRSIGAMRTDYLAFVEWRLERDEDDAAPAADPAPPPTARTADADRFWRADDGLQPTSWGARFTPLFHAPHRGGAATLSPTRPDMATVARLALAAEAPGTTVDGIRGRWGGRTHSRLRHIVIRRLHASGFSNVAIARYLGLSESAISYALREAPGSR